jgi:hypothetical protein
VVRLASASALGRLNLGGAGCVRSRLDAETNAKVLTALREALARIEGALEAPEPALGPQTRFYVAVDKVRGQEQLDVAVRRALLRGLNGNAAVAVAPRGQTTKQAEAVLGKFPAARGVKLIPTVESPSYVDGGVRVKLSLAFITYPGLALVGEFSQKATMGGVAEGDQKAALELIDALAEAAMVRFVKQLPELEL